MHIINKMMEYDMNIRISANEAFKHPYLASNTIYNNICEKTAIDILNNIKNFFTTEKLQQAVLSYIVHYNISKEEAKDFENIFRKFDVNGDGRLSISEIKEGFESLYGKELSDFQVESILKKMDLDQDNFVEYQEFLRVVLDTEMMINKNNLKSAFEAFDKDKNGWLDKKEIKQILGSAKEEYINELIEVLDDNGDGKISFDEFTVFMNEYATNNK
jgi:calcium-binding protein CML